MGERVGSLLTDGGTAPVDLFPVPTSIEGITPLVGRILVAIESAREKGEVVNVHVFHNRPGPGPSTRLSTRVCCR